MNTKIKNSLSVALTVGVVLFAVWYAAAHTEGRPRGENVSLEKAGMRLEESTAEETSVEEIPSKAAQNQIGGTADTVHTYTLIHGSPVNYPILLVDLPGNLVPTFRMSGEYMPPAWPSAITDTTSGARVGIGYGWVGNDMHNSGSGGGYVACPSEDGGVREAVVRLSDCEVVTNKHGIRYVKATNVNQLAENPDTDKTVTLYFRVETAYVAALKALNDPSINYSAELPTFFRMYAPIKDSVLLKTVADSVALSTVPPQQLP